MNTLRIALVAALVAWACFCFRQAAWHRHEAGFWREIAMFHRLGIAPADAPDLLRWAQTHRPSLGEKLRGWKPPHERRRERAHV